MFWGIPTDLTPSEKISEITNPGGTEAELLDQIAMELWANPELNYAEEFAHGYITDFLENTAGAEVERGFCGMPTAFRAVHDTGVPGPTVGIDYVLEYGTDRLELHRGQVPAGSRVILVDDLIATGGTAIATAQLLREQGASISMALFAIDLPNLGGRAALEAEGVPVRAILTFDGH